MREIQEIREAYDAKCKRVLARKYVLGCIASDCLADFYGLAPALIAERYIVGTPDVGTVPVMPDISPIIGPAGDKSSEEGEVFYDIKCLAKTPETGGELGMILNVEAQSRFNPGYWLPSRGFYYTSRLMSAQYGTFLVKSKYGNLLRVVSVWICTDPAPEFANTITRFSIRPENIFGAADYPRGSYDLLTVVMVCLGKEPEDDMNTPRVIKLLRKLMDAETTRASKEQFLRKEFPDFPMDEELKEELDNMSSLSQGIFDKGHIEGFLKALFLLVRDKLLTPSQGAERAAISLEDFTSRYEDFLRQAGN